MAQKLVQDLTDLLAYCEEQVSQAPGTFEVERAAYQDMADRLRSVLSNHVAVTRKQLTDIEKATRVQVER